MSVTRSFGWKRDEVPYSRQPESRKFRCRGATELRPVDLWQRYPPQPTKDQLRGSSCVGFGTDRAYQFVLKICGKVWFDPSPAYAYWGARFEGGGRSAVMADDGAQIADSVLSCVVNGMVPEESFPYSDQTFDRMPSPELRRAAVAHEALDYLAVDSTDQRAVWQALQQAPVIIGVELFASFDEGNSLDVPMPKPGEKRIGGHCMCGTGCDEVGVLADNSWGPRWRQDGRCRIPWSYVLNPALAGDFWTITSVI